ncbi:hypothetical protein HPT27_03660 [Permianibacter sp. IMCC34836]|uniref:hypothetical protein n=1 Tax=Permianibacter fluminis TaxID=2738515 RepID=UPI0015582885|nr:hypothetical protein [Permianibacter fluminis]NQD36107.1 hypothetical protein [Permianibacter fluminis]
MKRALIGLLLSTLALSTLTQPVLAATQASCQVAEQQDPKALINLFLSQEVAASPRGDYVKWDNPAPAYKGSEYLYPIEAPKLELDSLTVVSKFAIKEVKAKGNEATVMVELFTIADLWRPKGREDDAFGRRVTEIGEPMLQSYKLRREQGCWVLIDPPKPAVQAATVLSYLEQMLTANRNQTAEEATPETRKRVYLLEREVPMLKSLIRKYAPGLGV